MKYILPFCLFLTVTLSFGQAETEFDKPYISLGVIVSDLDASLDFYTEVIGMKQTGEFSVTGPIGESTGLTGGVPFDVKVLKLYDDPNATEYKLMSFKNDKNTPEKYIQERNGMRYTTIFLKSVEGVLKRIKSNNIKLLGETPIELPDGKTFILVQDPDGVFIELIGN
ncbi:VOC family protein [Flagellimonas sp. S3867]|uniref:VOC family protein n=1 Tax=Flagellimonas sp. S3867 TaxID=2768063 RepID=UPI001685F9F4|nr:VOC family protein [Flagellimonas sp. S3867]